MRVLSVASEIFPLIKTGGLADVTGALPRALAHEGVEVHSLVPGYPPVLQQIAGFKRTHSFDDLFGGPAHVLEGEAAGLKLFVIDAPHLYGRAGGPYADLKGVDWLDNAQRFAALSWVAARIARGFVTSFVPDLVHTHDWQAGLTPAYLALQGGKPPRTVITIHNLAHQGVFPADLLSVLRLPSSAFDIHGVEYYGQIGFLKAGIYFADRITTVSPTYAREILTEEGGMGLAGLLRSRASILSGILNGIDSRVWDPATDSYLAARFDAQHIESRSLNKTALQQRLGLELETNTLLFGVISRLSWQKGLDLLLDALTLILEEGAQLALLGAGERELADRFAVAAAAHPRCIATVLGYDEGLAHLIQGGCDALVVPSRFEPCGLTQLCALRYGAVPVVSGVGGLADAVVDVTPRTLAAGAATGVQFSPVSRETLKMALHRTAALWRERVTWRRLQAAGMHVDVDWTARAGEYARLYRDLSPGC